MLIIVKKNCSFQGHTAIHNAPYTTDIIKALPIIHSDELKGYNFDAENFKGVTFDTEKVWEICSWCNHRVNEFNQLGCRSYDKNGDLHSFCNLNCEQCFHCYIGSGRQDLLNSDWNKGLKLEGSRQEII